MDLVLTCDMAGHAARILNVLVTMENTPHRVGLGSCRIPQMNGKNQGTAARIVVEYGFGRRVRKNSAVPVEFAIDSDGWKGRGECARGHDMRWTNRTIAAIEIAHLAGTDICRSNSQSWTALLDEVEIDEVEQGFFKRRGRVEARVVATQRMMNPE